ncbi:ester cyclase [Candidatus Leptofilum sp.]|uniref:nuclear transport factor 2 family protein n=1 Tax=Candidatus Leptofilum sp. TaxID=3241576 RepID=UPI003B591B9D
MSSNVNQKNKAKVWDFWQKMNHVGADNMADVIRDAVHEDVDWNGSYPINQLKGVEALITGFWQPLRHSFPDIKRKADIFMGGLTSGEEWVSGLGYLTGTFEQDWLGIPASGKKTNIYFGQFYLMREGKIAESYVIYDILAVMRQAGFQVLPPARGMEGGKIPGPHTRDGVLLTEQDELETQKTGQLVMAMLYGLRRYVRSRDGDNLRSMEQAHYWQPQMHWYGLSGIGSCLSLEEFEDFHQRPWLRGFGDRGVQSDGRGRLIGLGGDDFLAEGKYAALGGWDSLYSRHNGEYGGVPGTGKLMTIRDFDWYRREGDLIAQNWVPIDIIDLFLQMGVDLFDRLRRQIELRNRGELWFTPPG